MMDITDEMAVVMAVTLHDVKEMLIQARDAGFRPCRLDETPEEYAAALNMWQTGRLRVR